MTTLEEKVLEIINKRIDFFAANRSNSVLNWTMGLDCGWFSTKVLEEVYGIIHFDRWNEQHQKALREVESEFSKYLKLIYIDRQAVYAIRTPVIKKRLSEKKIKGVSYDF